MSTIGAILSEVNRVSFDMGAACEKLIWLRILAEDARNQGRTEDLESLQGEIKEIEQNHRQNERRLTELILIFP